MAESRTKRSRKTINYAAFSGGDDSDDDFMGTSTLTVKSKADLTKLKSKPKQTQREGWDEFQKSAPAAQVISDSPAEPKKRLSRDEKFYQRELEQALKLSVQELSVSEPDLEVHNPSTQDTIPISTDSSTSSSSISSSPEINVPYAVQEIEIYDEPQISRESEESSESESEISVDSDSDSSYDKPKSKAKPSCTRKKQPEPKKLKSEPKPQAKPLTKLREVSPPAVSSKVVPLAKLREVSPLAVSSKVVPLAKLREASPPAVSSKVVPLAKLREASRPAESSKPVLKMPAWNPPSRTNDTKPSTPVGSPSSIGLRLGLSRKARVKPLHPGVQLKI